MKIAAYLLTVIHHLLPVIMFRLPICPTGSQLLYMHRVNDLNQPPSPQDKHKCIFKERRRLTAESYTHLSLWRHWSSDSVCRLMELERHNNKSHSFQIFASQSCFQFSGSLNMECRRCNEFVMHHFYILMLQHIVKSV